MCVFILPLVGILTLCQHHSLQTGHYQHHDHFYLVQVNPPRGEEPEKLREKLNKYNKQVQVSESVSNAIQAAKEFAQPKDLVCITGSIYTVAEAKKYLQNEKNLTNPGNSPHSRK